MTLNEVLGYITDNKDWIFSGIGVLVISGCIYLFRSLFGLRRSRVASEPRLSELHRPATNGQTLPPHWAVTLTEGSRYGVVTETSDSIPLGLQTFPFEYGPKGHAKPLSLRGNTLARAEIEFTCRIANPHKALFSANGYV